MHGIRELHIQGEKLLVDYESANHLGKWLRRRDIKEEISIMWMRPAFIGK